MLKVMELKKLIADQTGFSLKLACRVSSTDEAKNKNLVFSPLSLHVLLSLITAGSTGPTRDELLSVLRSQSSDDLNQLSSQIASSVFADASRTGGPELKFSNGLWIDETFPLKPKFKQVVDDLYKATADQVDFVNRACEVASQVNLWAKKQTNGHIKGVLPPDSVDDLTRLVFANALYFKGAWAEKFDASQTKVGYFHLLSGKSVAVPYMTSREEQYIQDFYDFKVLRLPYGHGSDHRKFTMYIYLPNKINGLASLVKKVCSEPSFVDSHIPHTTVEVGNFKLPKFKISFDFEASDVLKDLGVKLPFSPGGLTEMSDSSEAKNLYVSNIFQKSFIEVNEEGTEATAASCMVAKLLCYVPPINFVADHPFLFLIREETTGVVLFMGHVMDPSQC